ncbi:hypothetical protein [Azospirillum baldaniorum]|nr:hypothetical protein [Azospirillum baldaniorum]
MRLPARPVPDGNSTGTACASMCDIVRLVTTTSSIRTSTRA